MADRTQVTDEQMAWGDLGEIKPAICLERQNVLPFSQLSDDGFEILCYVLLLRENPGDRIYYYGKTGDRGRDIVHHRSDGTVDFIQCKRYTDNVGVGEIRKELAKLCANAFGNHLPVKPDRVIFYVVPDLSSGAQDLLASQVKWGEDAPAALKEHLGKKPSARLLKFAKSWWPGFEWFTAPRLGVRVEVQPALLDRFFAVKKVIEASASDLQKINEKLGSLEAIFASTTQLSSSLVPDAGKLNQPLTQAQKVVIRDRERTWEERARRSLDAHGQQLWEEIRTQIRDLSTNTALDRGKVLNAWLLGDGVYASATIRGKVCILLADLAVIESGIASLHERIEVAEARKWQTRAIEELGDSALPDDASRLIYLDARLTWLEGRPSEALTILDIAEDPNCESLKLSILFCEGRFEEAVAVARALPLDDRWCDRMVLAYARNGLLDDATTLSNWAKMRPDSVVYHRCLIANAQGTLQRLVAHGDKSIPWVGSLPTDDDRALREILRDLEKVFSAAVSRGYPSKGIETEALELAFVIASFLGERNLWQQYGGLLAKAMAPSLEFARAVCRGEIETISDLSARLRAEYPRSFTAGHVAAVLDANDGKPFSCLSQSVDGLIPLAETVEQKELISELLFVRALSEEGTIALEQAKEIGNRLLGSDHSLVRLVEGETLRRNGKTNEAEDRLATCQDENAPIWLQLAAASASLRGETKTALNYVIKTARMLGRSQLYWQAFTLANQAQDTVAAREIMVVLSRLTPEDPKVHHNLGAIDFRCGRFRDAVSWLQRVESLTPGDPNNGFFLGQALALAGNGDEAVKVLDRVCASNLASSSPHKLRALILDSLGQPLQAFERLQTVQERFWGEMDFVQLYHSLAYKANREPAAHFALLRLHELQNGNPDGPLRSKNLADLRELIRQERERHEHLNRLLLVGKLPWSMVGNALRREAYLDWVIRTQEVFVPDTPLARAEYAVYATNGFTVCGDPHHPPRSLEPITTGLASQPVVADLSALLTLHRLGLLDRALGFFGRIILPAGYVVLFLEENRSLQPHQASQNEARRAILRAVDQGRLRPVSPSDQSEEVYPLLDEHHVDGESVDFHLIDTVTWLQQSGRLNSEEVAKLKSVSHQPAGALIGSEFRLVAARGLRVRVSTLTTIHTVGLLERFLSSMRLFLAQDEIEELRRNHLGDACREEMNRWTRELRDLLSLDPRVETAEPTYPVTPEISSNPDQKLDPALDALLLADQRNLPLFADDRCLQAMVLNSRKGSAGAAFGTDALLASLAGNGRITEEEHLTAWLQLVRWRYRFLKPPPEILVGLAGRHASYPPGEELREVSRYLHDCCLDPGLFCGMEPVEPPVSVGWRYFQSIVISIGHFLMRVWHDPRFDQGARVALTRWTASELVPPPPRQLPVAGYGIACESIPRLVLVGALAEISFFPGDHLQSNSALVGIADSFGLSSDEYDDTVALLVESDICLQNEPQALAVDAAIRRLTAFSAMHHRQDFGLRVASALAGLGLISPLKDPVEESDLAALSDSTHHRRISLPEGPWVFLRGSTATESNSAHYVPELLFHPNRLVRCAAVGHLSGSTSLSDKWLTPGTRKVIASVAVDICSEESGKSRAAAFAANAALSKDFLLTIAIFNQARATRNQEASKSALQALLEPRSGVLQSVPSAWYGLPGKEWDGGSIPIVNDTEITVVLDRYYDRYGHLPLAASYAIETTICPWIEAQGTEGVWKAILTWASDESRPLKRYHAGRIFLALPNIVPPDENSVAWSRVADFFNGLEDQPEKPTLRGQAWLLLNTLARQYLQLLEVQAHDEDATALAALGWWAAERITHQLVKSSLAEFGPERAVGFVQGILLQSLIPSARRSAIGWVLGRSTRSPSVLAHGTLQGSLLWRLSLLESGPRPGLSIPKEQVEPIYSLFTVALVIGFPARLFDAPSPRIAVDFALASIVPKWASASSESVPTEEEVQGNEAASPTDQAESVEQVRALWELENDARSFSLQRFRNAIGIGAVTPKDMQWVMDNRQWWDHVFEQLPPEQLEFLFLSLFELMRSGGESWQFTLPHLFREQALRTEIPIEKRKSAAGAVVQVAIISGNLGALTGLVREAVAPELLASLADWRGRLNDIRPVVPPTVQAMIRTVLAVLPVDFAEFSGGQRDPLKT